MGCKKLVSSGLNILGRVFTVKYEDTVIKRRPMPFPAVAMELEIFKGFPGGTHFEGTVVDSI